MKFSISMPFHRRDLESYIQSVFQFLQRAIPPIMATFLHMDRYPDGFSDDESERDTTGSSLAAPLDMDTSPSLRHSHSSPASSFFSPRAAPLDNSYTGSLVRRRPATTAGSRARVSARTRAMARTPGGVSPGDIYILYETIEYWNYCISLSIFLHLYS